MGNVLYQLPCNCRCDRALGHTSLRSCFEGLHGTECSTCAKEGFYAYQKTKLGKTPAQIRAGIARHEYEIHRSGKAIETQFFLDGLLN